MKKAAACLSFLLLSASLAHSQLVSFKLMGGLSWINGNDYNRGIDGLNSYLQSVSSVQGAYKKVMRGPDLEGEILVYWGTRAAVGFGGGFSDISHKSRVVYSNPVMDVTDSTYEPHVSTIPLYLNVHFLPRLGQRLRLDLFAGPVFQVVQFRFSDSSSSTYLMTRQTESFSSSTTALGAQAGLGLQLKISGGVSFVAQGCYRYGKTAEITGNWSLIGNNSSGNFANSSDSYFFWAYDYTTDKTYQRWGFFDLNGPAGDFISNARKARIDLSGARAMAGVMFTF